MVNLSFALAMEQAEMNYRMNGIGEVITNRVECARVIQPYIYKVGLKHLVSIA